MLGLEPSAIRCAGSSPVPGTLNTCSFIYCVPCGAGILVNILARYIETLNTLRKVTKSVENTNRISISSIVV